MNILNLLVKTRQGAPMEARHSLSLRRGVGIVGDIHARVGSPRQVLLVSEPVLQEFGLPPGALRENILVDFAIETLPSGQVIQVGSNALIRLIECCEPCAYLNTLHPGLARKILGKRGVLGMVVRDGVVGVGDGIALTPYQFPLTPETTRAKVEGFIARVPAGKVVRTTDILHALGLTRSYYRVIGGFLKKMPHVPTHRVVSSDGRLLTRHLPQQREQLAAEGVDVQGDRVPNFYYWEAQFFHELGNF